MTNSTTPRPTFSAGDRVQLVRNPSADRWSEVSLEGHPAGQAQLLAVVIANGQVLSAEGTTMAVNSLPGIVEADSSTGVFVDDDAHMFVHTHNQE